MRTNPLSPAAQTRPGGQKQVENREPIVRSYGSIQTTQSASRQVLSQQQYPTPSKRPFPPVVRSAAQPQQPHYLVQPFTPPQVPLQPTHHKMQVVTPPVRGLDSKPLFPATKERK